MKVIDAKPEEYPHCLNFQWAITHLFVDQVADFLQIVKEQPEHVILVLAFGTEDKPPLLRLELVKLLENDLENSDVVGTLDIPAL